MTYQSQLPDYDHQARAKAALEGQTAFALFMAMRTGKTKVAIDDFGSLVDQDLADDMLVVAPAGAYEPWASEVEKHLDRRLLSRARVLVWSAQKTTAAQVKEFLAYRGGPRVLLVNVEALSSVERARALVLSFTSQRRCVVVVDESTTIKNPRAKRTKFFTKQVRPLAAYRRILSGLPSPRSPLDVYSQFEFLDPSFLGSVSYRAFEQRYAVTRPMRVGGRQINIVVGYRNTEELGEKVQAHAFRVRLEDCYDLPPKTYVQRHVPLDNEQRRVYEAIRKQAYAELREGVFVTATEVITQMLRMHQVLCGHVGDELGNQQIVPELRTRELMTLLEEYEGKAVVWCSYDFSVEIVTEALREAYGDGSVARFWGGNKATREGEEIRFKNDPQCRFMVATPAAGGRGRDWSVADLVIYYSSTPDLEHRSQSEERTQAVNKSRSVLYVDLVAPGTVDEKIIKALRAKIDLATTITGDDYQEWLI